jgi:hypothetical protein
MFGSLYISRQATANGKFPCNASSLVLCLGYSRGRGEMSDEREKPAGSPKANPGKPHTVGTSARNDAVPEDVVTPIDGEIDLARLAPQLRGLYQELLNEPIPDRFTKLLDELALKETDKQ